MLSKLIPLKTIKPRTIEPTTLPVLIGSFQVNKSVIEELDDFEVSGITGADILM